MGILSAIKMAIIIVSLLGVGGAYWYVTNLQDRLEQARANVIRLEEAVAVSEASLERLQKESQRLTELNQDLQVELIKAERYGDELRATLQRHNLTHLATKKPSLIEKRMQNATDRLWDDLFSITDTNSVQQSGTDNQNSNENRADSSTVSD